MAYTSGGKKLIWAVILSVLFAGGGYFYSTHKKPVSAPVSVSSPSSTVSVPAVEQTVPAAPQAVVAPIAVSSSPIKKHVAKAHVEKKVHHSSVSHGGSQPAVTHESSDAAALKAIAGDKL